MIQYKIIVDKKLNAVIVSMNFTLRKCSPTIIGGENAILHNFTFVNGRKFPPSYVSFVRQYGYGLSCGLFIIYIPMGDYPDSFFIRSKEIISTYQDVLNNKEELWFDVAPDLEYSKLKDLIPFGVSENGDYLFWDIMSKESEMDIYITDFRATGFLRVARDLYDFFYKVTSPDRYKEVLPFAQEMLPNTFQTFAIDSAYTSMP